MRNAAIGRLLGLRLTKGSCERILGVCFSLFCFHDISMRSIICREGVYYLAVIALVFFGAIPREANLLLLFGSLLLCPVFIAWRLERSTLRHLRVKRKMPPSVVAGEAFHVSLELTNPRRRLSSWAVVVEDTIQLVKQTDGNNHALKNHSKDSQKVLKTESQSFQPAVYFEYVKVGSTLKKSYSGCIPRRGKYRLGPMVLSTRFPVGFFRTTLPIDEKASEVASREFYVYPRWGKLVPHWLTRQHQSDENRQKRRFRSSRISGEFLGVRHWQTGDVKKWIHWRASAKHRDLVVRQYEQHQNRDAAVILDLFHPDPLSVREMETIELSVSFAATLVNELAKRRGTNLIFGTVGSGDWSCGNVSADWMSGQVCLPLLDRIMERLAVISPGTQDTLLELLLQILPNTASNADIFLVSRAPIDMVHSPRFEGFRNDPRLRVLSQRTRLIDVSSPEWEEVFILK